MPKLLTKEQIQKDFPEIWQIMISKGKNFNEAKALYRKQLEKSFAGYESQLDKEVAELKEGILNDIFAEVFAHIKEKYGIELVEDPEGKIIIGNEIILASIVAILKEVSPILAHPESHHVSIELTRDENGEWEMQIINRAE